MMRLLIAASLLIGAAPAQTPTRVPDLTVDQVLAMCRARVWLDEASDAYKAIEKLFTQQPESVQNHIKITCAFYEQGIIDHKAVVERKPAAAEKQNGQLTI